MVITNPEAISDIMSKQDPPFYFATTNEVEGLIDADCIDCRLQGGTTVKPDFWVD
ncbi:MAG: hypothetical protein KQH79_12810 [Bacteroidetes bacterium]|nr:hypothetical protein [Bacteroidota bacterium]